MAIVTLRYWAAAKEAAGTAEEKVSAGTLAEALAAACGDADGGGPAGPGHDRRNGQHGRQEPAERNERDARLRAIVSRSSFLVDGTPVGTRAPESVELGDGSVVEVLPPFAGG